MQKLLALSDAYFDIKYTTDTEVKDTISGSEIFNRYWNVIMLILVVYLKDFGWIFDEIIYKRYIY